MGALARKFIHAHPHHFKLCLFDESWILGKTVEGKSSYLYARPLLYASADPQQQCNRPPKRRYPQCNHL